ncbi:MAG: hypothetical protein LBD03_03355 [Methanobrevibacter sp.]|jgi:hypothetical protein|nr:hypothetical protein [Candidatus Methanovirga procula]
MENSEMENNKLMVNHCDIFISALDDRKEEVEIILKIIENYKNEKMPDMRFNIVGNSHVKTLINKNSKLNRNTEDVTFDDIKGNEGYLDVYIGIIGDKIKDSNYPNINLRNDFNNADLIYENGLFILIFLLSSNEKIDEDIIKDESIYVVKNNEVHNFKKDVIKSQYFPESYENIEEFKDEVEFEVESLLEDFCDETNLFRDIFTNDEEDFDPVEAAKDIFLKGLGLSENDEIPDDANPTIKELLEDLESENMVEYDDDLDSNNDRSLINSFEANDSDGNGVVMNFINAFESGENIFNWSKNIVVNFAEFLFLAIYSIEKFMTYVPEEGDEERELYISGNIFSDNLKNLLKLFKDSVVEDPDFDKAINSPQSYIESISSISDIMDDDMLKLLKYNFDEFVKLDENYEAIIVYMKGLHKLSEEEMDKGYGALLLELVANMELVLKHIKTINTCIGKLDI